MRTLKTTAAVTLALLLALTGAADAGSHRITADDSTTPTTHPLDPGTTDTPNGGDAGGGPSTHPHHGGLSANPQSIPMASMSCGYIPANNGFWGGAYMTNTGNVTVHAGSRVIFHFPGGDLIMVVSMDVVPGGQWAFFDDGDPNFSFPAGTVVPYGTPCSFDLVLA